jgi:hypothetical protein
MHAEVSLDEMGDGDWKLVLNVEEAGCGEMVMD